MDKARIAAGVVIGLDEPVIIDLPAQVAPPDTDLDTLLGLAHGQRAELQAARAAVEATGAQVRAAQLGLAPNLSAGLATFAATEPYPTGKDTGWRGTLDLSWPLVTGGLRAGQTAKARAAVADAEANLRQLELQVTQQLRAAVADQDIARARLDLATRQRFFAEEAARVAERSYQEGELDLAGALESADRLDLARMAELDARARLGIESAALGAAAGRW